MRMAKLILSGATILALGLSSFLIVRVIRDDSATEAQEPPAVRLDVELERVQAALGKERVKPRFVGWIGGVFIAPSVDQYPPKLRDAERAFVGDGCDSGAPREVASAVDLANTPSQIADMSLAADEPTVFTCGGALSGISFNYHGLGQNGLPSNVLVARSTSRARGVDWAADKVGTVLISGISVVFARPATPDGTAQTSVMVIAEPFGLTAIHGFNLSEAEMVLVAQAVIAAGR